MTQSLDFHEYANGLVLLAEPMAEVQSAAFGLFLPAGAACLPKTSCGAANIILDWIFRGAGTRDSRQLNDALDTLGLHRAGSVSSAHLSIGGVLEAGNLPAALDLYADIVLRPSLEADQFELSRQLAQDEVLALDDDPRQKVMLALRERYYPTPLGTSTVGDLHTLQSLDAAKIRELANEHLSIGCTILALAGKYDFKAIRDQIESLFGDVSAAPPQATTLGESGPRCTHLAHEGAQVHMGLMTPTVTITHPDYYQARVAVSILSGGMSARLFTEVREKRGLCYAIGAHYQSMKDVAGISCYAGTTPDKTEETLAVIQSEFRNLAQGITQDELDRAKVGLKAALILQSESSSSRVGAIGGDYYLLGRVRSLDEIKAGVEAVTVESVTDFLLRHPFEEFTQVTIGPASVDSQA